MHRNNFFFELSAVLKVRWKQFYRTLSGMGVVYSLLLFGIVLTVGTAVFLKLTTPIPVYAISFCWVLFCFGMHAKRRDYTFLQLTFNHPRFICSIEYVLYSLPFVVCLLLKSQWLAVGFVLVFAFGAGFSTLRKTWGHKTRNTRLQKYLPDGMYEWKSGVRRMYWMLLFSWIVGFFTSFFIASVPVALFSLGVCMIDFFEKNESWQMLLSFQKKTNAFLSYKIGMHLVLFSLVTWPLLFLFILFHPAYWYIPVIEYVVFISIHVFAILQKYALFSYDKEASNRSIPLLIGISLGLILVTTPVLWLYSVRLYFKARSNLNHYLYDFN